MLGFGNDVKERKQIHYHIDVLQGHENVLMSRARTAPATRNYHYDGFQRRYEAIRTRIKADPHEYPIVREEHIGEAKRRFEEMGRAYKGPLWLRKV